MVSGRRSPWCARPIGGPGRSTPWPLRGHVVVVFALGLPQHVGPRPTRVQRTAEPHGALYFTVVTLATIGYGDIAARTDVARTVVMIQVVVNIVILGSAVKVIAELARRSPFPAGRGPD